ncbi:MAG: hypothetical protein HFH67_08725 [Lachnospiraceae bacterium]|nr:hypothetical protein [Lachnospiraceae bacterium]
MIKEKKHKISEEEAVKAFLVFRNFPSEKQAFAIAFINGMEFQRELDNAKKQFKKEAHRE